MLRILTIILFLLALLSVANAQDPISPVDRLISTYEKADREARTLRAFALEELRPKYIGALDRYAKTATDAGNLDGVLATRMEKERVENGLAAADELSETTEIARMQETLNRRVAELDKARDAKVHAAQDHLFARMNFLLAELTRRGLIEEAVATREKMTELKADKRFARFPKYSTKAGTANWTVLLRGHDFRNLLDTKTLDARRYAIPLANVPETVRFLRIAALGEEPEAVIMPITHAGLLAGKVEAGPFLFVSNEDHFGLVNLREERKAPAYVYRHNRTSWGWGLQRNPHGEDIDPATLWGDDMITSQLEIAFTSDDLSPAEEKLLLVDEAEKKAPPKREDLAHKPKPPPPSTKGAIVAPPNAANYLGGAKAVDGGIFLPAGGMVEWNLAKLKPGTYSIIVRGSGKGRVVAQGVRDLTSTRNRVVIADRNVVSQPIKDDGVRLGTIQLGGPVKLQLIGSGEDMKVSRVEIAPR